MVVNDHSNITLLKEIAELLNEETELIPMLKGALKKFLAGTNFTTGWIFFINEKGKINLVVHENLPEGLCYNDCQYLKKGGCWCVSRFRRNELKKHQILLNVKELKMPSRKRWAIRQELPIMQRCHYNRVMNGSEY